MFYYQEAEAYHKLRGAIMKLVEAHSKEYKEHDKYQLGKLHAFSDVISCMIEIDLELNKEIKSEVDKEEEKENV